LEPVPVNKTLVHQVADEQAAEVIPPSEEKEEHSGAHETLRLKREIGDQPTNDADGDNRTERSNDHKAEQATKIS
jgi:hypothetical protein